MVWDNWQKFNGEQKNPSDSTDFLIPTVSGTNVQNQTLWDYFGLPTNVNKALKVNALPFRAYNLIFNEWFRDENLQDSFKVPTGDGPDNLSDYNVLRRYRDWETDRKSTRLNSSHRSLSRMPSSA